MPVARQSRFHGISRKGLLFAMLAFSGVSALAQMSPAGLWRSVDDKTGETKGRYEFPFGDFTKVHRCGVISLESRAAQYDHDEIAKAAKALLELIDGD